MKVLITGSREYPRLDVVRAFIRHLAAKYPDAVVVHGAAGGVDTEAGEEATECGLAVVSYPVRKEDWEAHGRRAGRLRNEAMLADARPDVVVAFHDCTSPGTAHMIGISREAGVPVYVYGPDGKGVR